MKVNQDVMQVLDNRVVCDGPRLILTGQLDRKLYVATNKVLEAAGGKWNKREKAHLFTADAQEVLDGIFLTGEVATQQDTGYFPTPPQVVKRLMGLAKIEHGMSVLEPSAGTGNIAREIAKITSDIDCIEFLPDNVRSLQREGFAASVTLGDFLGIQPTRLYDRIVMNPPFSRQADIHHVKHALGFLGSGGLLVSVMSLGTTFRENRLSVEFRELLSDREGSFHDLPAGSFKSSGTMVNTVICVIPSVV